MFNKYKQYNSIEPWLQEIYKEKLKLSGKKVKKHNDTIYQLLQCLKNCFMKDELFNLLFNRFYMSGSFGDRLKIKEPDEFFQNILDEDNNICIDKMQSWFQHLVTTAVNSKKYQIFDRVKKICISGPVITLTVESKCNKIFFVMDLSPCLTFNKPITLGTYNFISNEYFMVPKPLDRQRNDNISWRLSYNEQEREMLFKDRECFVKLTIQFMKLFRDNDRNIKSYYIKTMALTMINEDNTFFHRKSKSYSFIQFLLRLRKSIADGGMPPLWDEEIKFGCNPKYLADFNNRIDNFINLVNSVNKMNKAQYKTQFMSYFNM